MGSSKMSELQTLWTNNVLARLRQGLPAFGISVRGIRSGDIAHVAKASGHHFLFVDTQHSIFSKESLYQMWPKFTLKMGLQVLKVRMHASMVGHSWTYRM